MAPALHDLDPADAARSSRAGARPARPHLVLVAFGAEAARRLEQQVRAWLRGIDAVLEVVDTSKEERLANGQTSHDAFEFSGYQYGLERTLARARREGRPEDVLSVLFVNETIATGHVPALGRSALAAALSLLGAPGETPVAVGIGQRADEATRLVASLGFYYPTYVFGVRAPARLLEGLTLYDASIIPAPAFEAVAARLDPRYHARVREFLCPRGLLSGWYKASPFRATDGATLFRKSLSIFLELSLPSRLRERGFTFVDLLAERSGVRLWRRVDALWLLREKLRRRLPDLARRLRGAVAAGRT